MIIDRFSRGSTHGNDVSDVFESIAANTRSTCDVFSPSSVGKCYELMNSKQVGNLSREELFFEQNQQDNLQVSQNYWEFVLRLLVLVLLLVLEIKALKIQFWVQVKMDLKVSLTLVKPLLLVVGITVFLFSL